MALMLEGERPPDALSVAECRFATPLRRGDSFLQGRNSRRQASNTAYRKLHKAQMKDFASFL